VGHGLFLTEEEIRVPLILKLPKSLHGGSREKRVVSLLDVAPTLLAVFDLDVPRLLRGDESPAIAW
jgi:arylsulfatase A-like enzyme